jgi:hypothetical protein
MNKWERRKEKGLVSGEARIWDLGGQIVKKIKIERVKTKKIKKFKNKI